MKIEDKNLVIYGDDEKIDYVIVEFLVFLFLYDRE